MKLFDFFFKLECFCKFDYTLFIHRCCYIYKIYIYIDKEKIENFKTIDLNIKNEFLELRTYIDFKAEKDPEYL